MNKSINFPFLWKKKGKIKNQNEKYEKKIIATTMDGEK